MTPQQRKIMPSRFYYPPPWPNTPEISLSDEVFHHAVTVLRMRVGEVCELFDGKGHCAAIELIQIDKKSARARWLSPPTLQISNESPLNITLAQCLSSAEKMDWTIEKAVELGVNRIVPIFSSRSQIKLSHERSDKKMAHWQRIIVSACAQSGRNVCPELLAPMSLSQWLGQSIDEDETEHKINHKIEHEPTCRLILHPDPQLPHTLSQLPRAATRTIHLLIGPESGFDDKELILAKQASYQATLLGPRVLRTETAGLATLSAIQALWGDF